MSRMLWKKAAVLGLIGFVLGALIGICFRLFLAPGSAAEPLQLLMGGIYGAVSMGSSVIYEIEKWSILRATATHFLLIFSLYICVSLSLGWFRADEPLFWIVIIVMAVGYVLVWLLQWLSCRRKIRAMNDDLQKCKAEKEAD